jgi:hypothetical protein
MANEDLFGLNVLCTICGRTIDPKRALRGSGSVTCSKEHADLRIRLLRKKVDDAECRFCHKPSTPNRRRAFSRFNAWEKAHPDQAFPDVWAIVSADGMTLKELGAAVMQSKKRDIELDVEFHDQNWATTKTPKPDDSPTPELDRVLTLLTAAAEAKIAAAKEKTAIAAQGDDFTEEPL